MLKIFLTGDNHIGENKANTKLHDNRINVFTNMVDKANEEKCDVFVIAGDLFDDNSVKKKELINVLNILKKFNGTVVLLPGNHDYYDIDSELWGNFNEIKNEYKNVLLLNEYREYSIKCNDCDVLLYPALCKSKHPNPGENNLGWIKKLNLDKTSGIRIGIAHGAIDGETYDTEEGDYFKMTRDELNGLPIDLWLIGHTHVPFPKTMSEKYESTKETIFNAGTHVQEDVSRDTDGYCFIIELDGNKNVKAKKFMSGNLFYKRITINVKPGELESKLNRELKKYKDNTKIDLRLNGRVDIEEYDNKEELIESELKRFNEELKKFDDSCTYSTLNLNKVIDQKYINSKYPETSIYAKLLTALLGDPKETQMADELLDTLREEK